MVSGSHFNGRHVKKMFHFSGRKRIYGNGETAAGEYALPGTDPANRLRELTERTQDSICVSECRIDFRLRYVNAGSELFKVLKALL